MSTVAFVGMIIGMSTLGIALVFIMANFVIPWIMKLDQSAMIKPHVYRDKDGRFIVRCYRLFGRKYLSRVHVDFYTFSTYHKDRRRFTSLEDATQAFEQFTERLSERLEREREEKAEKIALKKASGIVHRFGHE